MDATYYNGEPGDDFREYDEPQAGPSPLTARTAAEWRAMACDLAARGFTMAAERCLREAEKQDGR